MNIQTLTIANASAEMERGEMTASALLSECLLNIQRNDFAVHAFLEVWEDEARARASDIDARRARGEKLGRLAGIPIAIKDNILYKNHHASGASRILEPYTAAYSATVIERLLADDAVLIGRTNMDEFACGGSTENSAFGVTSNPFDASRVAGGSSGGSASAVAEGMCLGALGSDTGGSIRQPASFCGVVGLKPTYGRVSRYGLMAMASSLDCIGPLGKNVDDCARILEVIEGKDAYDATSEDISTTHYERATSLKGIRVGVPKEYFEEKGIDREVGDAIDATLADMTQKGATLVSISLPHAQYALATYYVLMPCEVSSNVSRYDGIRYGLSQGSTLNERYVATRVAGFGTEVKRRIILGTFALSAGYVDAYYKKSVAVRSAIARDFQHAFDEVDVVVSPTSPFPAFLIGERSAEPLSMYLADVYTVSANLAGIPAISVPCRTVLNLPVGIQFMAPHFQESKLLSIAHAVSTI